MMALEDLSKEELIKQNNYLTRAVGALCQRLGGGEIKVPIREWAMYDGTETISVEPNKHAKGMIIEVRK